METSSSATEKNSHLLHRYKSQLNDHNICNNKDNNNNNNNNPQIVNSIVRNYQNDVLNQSITANSQLYFQTIDTKLFNSKLIKRYFLQLKHKTQNQSKKILFCIFSIILVWIVINLFFPNDDPLSIQKNEILKLNSNPNDFMIDDELSNLQKELALVGNGIAHMHKQNENEMKINENIDLNETKTKKLSVKLPESAEFTIISLLREMSAETLLTNKNQYIFQYSSILSWISLVPPENIIVFMDSVEMCNSLYKQNQQFIKINCLPVRCWHSKLRKPLLNCIFNDAHSIAKTDIIVYVNGDILLSTEIPQYIRTIEKLYNSQFLIVTQRTDLYLNSVSIDRLLNEEHEFIIQLFDDKYLNGKDQLNANELRYALHGDYGIDLFIYHRSFFSTFLMPPFLAGVYRWDNYVLSRAILNDDMNVVDITKFGLILHQQENIESISHLNRLGAQYNDQLVKMISGNDYKLGKMSNSHQRMSCSTCLPISNLNASIEILYRKYSDEQNYILVIEIGTLSHIENTLEYLDDTICQLDRIRLKNVIFLTTNTEIEKYLINKRFAVITPQTFLKISTKMTRFQYFEEINVSKTPNANSDEPQRNSQLVKLYMENFSLFKTEVILSVLRARYNIIFTSIFSILIDLPFQLINYIYSDFDLIYFDENDLPSTNFQSNQIYLSDRIFSIRSSNMAIYYWKQVTNCQNKQVKESKSSKLNTFISCMNSQLKLVRKLKIAKFDSFLFPTLQEIIYRQLRKKSIYNGQIFTEKLTTTQLKYSSVLPMIIVDSPVFIPQTLDLDFHKNQFDQNDELNSMNIRKYFNFSTNVNHSNECEASHDCQFNVPHFSRKTLFVRSPSKYQRFDLSLLIRIMTSTNYNNLNRLLMSLKKTSSNLPSTVDLEIILQHPNEDELLKNPFLKENWNNVQSLVRSFEYDHGEFKIIEIASEQSKFQPNYNSKNNRNPDFNEYSLDWYSDDNSAQLLMLLKDNYVFNSKWYDILCSIIEYYYISPENYDPKMFGISLQKSTDQLVETGISSSSKIQSFHSSYVNNENLKKNDPFLNENISKSRLYGSQNLFSDAFIWLPRPYQLFRTWLIETENSKSALPCIPFSKYNKYVLDNHLNQQSKSYFLNSLNKFVWENGGYWLSVENLKFKSKSIINSNNENYLIEFESQLFSSINQTTSFAPIVQSQFLPLIEDEQNDNDLHEIKESETLNSNGLFHISDFDFIDLNHLPIFDFSNRAVSNKNGLELNFKFAKHIEDCQLPEFG